MIEIPFRSTSPLDNEILELIKEAKDRLTGDKVRFVRSTDDKALVINPSRLRDLPFPERYLALAMSRFEGMTPTFPDVFDNALFLDIETHNEGKQWDMPLPEFFRLGQYAWGWDGEIRLTTDLDEVLSVINEADLVIAHNGHSFDFSVLLGNKALSMTKDRLLFDTFVHANLTMPAPAVFEGRDGRKVATVNAEGKTQIGGVRKWLALDNLAFRLGVPGKIGDLKVLAKKYNPPKTKVADYDYGVIPLDDPEFLEYARQDIVALRGVTRALLVTKEVEEYDWREQLSAAINAQLTRNGFRLDVPKAKARVAELAQAKADLLGRLNRDYGFPTTGSMPWRTTEGKEAIFKILADSGITPQSRPDWPLTATKNYSLSGDALKALTEGTEVEDLGIALAELQGQRPLAQQALDYVRSDSRVHHDIAAIQRSGRSSTTKPSLTTWSDKGPKAVEKDYFIASEGHVLMEFDLSNADQRIIAAVSGDLEYAKRFDEGVDGHEINGRIMFGDEVYDSEPKYYRDQAKAPGHGWTYGGQPKKLAWITGLPLETMEKFAKGMAEMYPTLTAWQSRVRRRASRQGFTTNLWGRKMLVERQRAFTMAPALHGQSGTSEIAKDGLIRMLELDPRLLEWTVATVHDALILDFPKSELHWVPNAVKSCLETTINGIEFPVENGPPGETWYQAKH